VRRTGSFSPTNGATTWNESKTAPYVGNAGNVVPMVLIRLTCSEECWLIIVNSTARITVEIYGFVPGEVSGGLPIPAPRIDDWCLISMD